MIEDNLSYYSKNSKFTDCLQKYLLVYSAKKFMYGKLVLARNVFIPINTN